MDARDLILVALLGGVAWWFARSMGALDAPVFSLDGGGDASPIFNLPNAPVALTPAQADALNIINDLNASQFGGFFDASDVMASISTESSFRSDAYRADRNGGSFGLMQLNLAAAQQVGYGGDANGLLDPATNIQFGMAYLVWIWSFLASRLGHEPSEVQWITAYNAGVGNVLKGYANTAYYTKWRGFRDQWLSALVA